MTEITITRPDDFHLHLRDGETLKTVVAHTANEFARAVIMPNLVPPVTNIELAKQYKGRILKALPEGSDFEPLMTFYLTDDVDVDEIRKAAESGLIQAVKLYPAGATTNSDSGVTDFSKVEKAFEVMAEIGLPLLIHGEVTGADVDVFDREARFIEETLDSLRKRIPELKIVMEHITTKQAAKYVAEADNNLAASITAHHLLMNRNAIFQGGINPHHYCLPILKREEHRLALVEAATSGSNKFFLGTDSAPHPKGAKESACGCAGMYSAFAAMSLYTEVFEKANALDKLEAFASFNGPDYYGIKRNSGTITLVKEEWTMPNEFKLGDDTLVPLRAGGKMAWKVKA
jgi:dihydroorotase